MENAGPGFRSSISGYNKQDVNEYIASLSEGFSKERAELKKQIAELSAESASLRERVEAVSSAEADTDDADAKLMMADALISEQAEQLNAAKAQAEELRASLEVERAEVERLRVELARYSESEEKLREYDRMSQKLGEIMIKAASSAEQIKNEAQLEAEKTLKSSEARKNELIEKENELARSLDERYSTAVAAINRKLSELVNKGFDALNYSMKSADEEVAALLESRRSAARAAVLQTAEALPELEALARLGEGS